MAPNPTENQKDVGQFNAWLHNIGQTKVPQRPQAGGPGSTAAPRPAPRPPVPPGGGILGEVDSEIDDVFGRIVSDGPGAAPPPAMAARPEPPKAPPSRADVDRLIAAAQAQIRPSAAPSQRPAMPAAPQAATGQPQSIFGRPIAPTQAPKPQPQVPRPAPPAMPDIEPQVQQPSFEQGSGTQAQVTQLQAAHQQELARVENSFLDAKSQLQKQVKDIQLKYQEQRTKWENVLADLRIRNDELLRRNQELEQQVEQMTERHRQLFQEYADMRGQTADAASSPPQTAPLPEEIGVPQGQFLKGEFEIPAIAMTGPDGGGINIESSLPEQSQQERAFDVQPPPDPVLARIAPEMSFHAPGEAPAATPSPAEADDLLAELEALEKEMKDIGGK